MVRTGRRSCRGRAWGLGMRLEDLDFQLPAELIAQHPTARRDACRLLHWSRDRGAPREHRFEALPDLLRAGDLLVRNVTRVIPARMFAIKEGTGARCEVLLVEPDRDGTWWAMVRPARRLPAGAHLRLADGTRLEVVETAAAGKRRLAFEDGVDALACAQRHGVLPLPPYIRRSVESSDADAYQTVYARVDGSVAAPTAGLHFTPELFEALRARDIDWVDVVLHIGPGTFEPLRSSDPYDHVMHWERFEAPAEALERVRTQRRGGGRVVAVGTTATRVLESVAAWEAGDAGEAIEAAESADGLRGRTRLFIHAPYRWRSVDALLTNFHLPRSTLLLLVDAFAGRASIRSAYAWAVEHRFRFFSYGDAMFID